jgi:predicted ATPase with chaperone activity
MLARRLTTLLPAMTLAEAIETTRLIGQSSFHSRRCSRPVLFT